MRDQKAIVSLGILVVDLIGGPLLRLPERGSMVLVEEMGLYPGGCAVNTAIDLARLGFPVKLIGKVGRDALGDFLLTALTRQGVDTQGLCQDPETGTSTTMVMIDPDGERRFVHFLGANAHLTLADVDLKLITDAAILHVAGHFVMPGLDGEPLAELLQLAKDAGVTTFMDTAWDVSGRWFGLIAPCLPHVDYFVPSLAEARAISGREEPVEVAAALLDQGVGTVAVKMGAAGCLVMAGDRRPLWYPAFRVDVVDATGAGDAFAAGFIAGVFLGWPLDQTARLANAVGAMCVTGLGAQGGVASLEETLVFMEERRIGQDLQD